MKKVMMTRFGKDRGNCLQACLASVLDLEIEEVPDFMESSDWLQELVRWSAREGYGMCYLDHVKGTLISGAWVILVHQVVGQDAQHAVVAWVKADGLAWQGYLEHDPNPRKWELGELVATLMIFKQR